MIYKGILFCLIISKDFRSAFCLTEYTCDGNQNISLKEESIILKSPNYPQFYKGRIDCSFNIKTSPNQNLTMECSIFRVTGLGPKCIFGGVEINGQGHGEDHELLCGSYSTLKLSRRNVLFFNFYNKYFQNKGFMCVIKAQEEEFKCKCGTKNVNSRIVGGKEVEENEYPWHIGIVNIGENLPFCGGALVTDRHVVTAGHCFQTFRKVEILLGEHNIRNSHDTALRIRVKKVEVHKEFNIIAKNDYDITLLTLERPIKFRREIQPICLPFKDEDFVGTMCTITGWGRLNETGPQPDILQEVNVPVITNDVCKKSYKTLTPRLICAGYMKGELDACQGDSGGPLSCPQNNRYVLVGSTSYGVGCARPGFPGVYSRITVLQDWINERIGDGVLCD
ncbi:venom protease [Lepeophtheirus salmonis]|uniref:venom protease n=1 Tax=Lepeophtheirus salmonis TaxID=72036 RepID=UPI003AF3B8E8